MIENKDEYSTHYEPRIWRRWAIELTLRDERIVPTCEDTTDDRAGETKTLPDNTHIGGPRQRR